MSKTSSQKDIETKNKNSVPADYYLYMTTATPSVTSQVTTGDTVISINSDTGITAGQAVTFYEDDYMYQSLVVAKTSNSITLASPIDFDYTTSALVEVGTWSMNVDGGSVSKEFSIKAPPNVDIDVHTITMTMLDATAMDDGTFGGIASLTNGIYFSFEDGFNKNLAVIVNNLGFYEIGFDTSYSDKAPSGQYGFRRCFV